MSKNADSLNADCILEGIRSNNVVSVQLAVDVKRRSGAKQFPDICYLFFLKSHALLYFTRYHRRSCSMQIHSAMTKRTRSNAATPQKSIKQAMAKIQT